MEQNINTEILERENVCYWVHEITFKKLDNDKHKVTGNFVFKFKGNILN